MGVKAMYVAQEVDPPPQVGGVAFGAGGLRVGSCVGPQEVTGGTVHASVDCQEGPSGVVSTPARENGITKDVSHRVRGRRTSTPYADSDQAVGTSRRWLQLGRLSLDTKAQGHGSWLVASRRVDLPFVRSC
jgi:hypothetical protein